MLELNIALKIMAAILKTVLKREKDVRDATDSYIDDIQVDQTAMVVQSVLGQLEKSLRCWMEEWH